MKGRALKSTIHSAKAVVVEPMLHIEKCEDDVYKLVCLVQNECTGIKLEDIIQSIKESVDNFHSLNVERRKHLAAWINGIDTKNTYETSLQYHHDGTCEWALKLEELQAWESEEHSRARLLWIHGPAGFGKTFMSAWIIRHLKEKNQGPLSYFFSVADNQPTRDPYSILRSWLTQILEQDEAILPVMNSFFNSRTNEQTLTHLGLWELFVVIGESIPGCTFIVDGFDECTHVDSGARYHQNDPRNYFLREMLKNLPKTKSRVLVVSRDVPDIREFLGKDSVDSPEIDMFEYQITAKDTTADVKSFSESMVNEKLPKKPVGLRQKIADQAAERSEGMFLWIKLLEQEISPGQNAKELTATVHEMPSGISEAYSRELDKIAQLSLKNKDKAVMILRWILFAIRPLQVKELAEALVVSDEDLDEYPEDDLPDTWQDGFVDEDYVKEMILGRCGSLLQLRSSSQRTPLANHTVHFVHFSVKEYLSSLSNTETPNQWSASLGLADGVIEEIRLSNICLRYLTLNAFEEMPRDTDIYPFLSYASWAWYFHSFHRKPTPSKDIMDRTRKAFDPATSRWRVWTPLMEAELVDSDGKEWDFVTDTETDSDVDSNFDSVSSRSNILSSSDTGTQVTTVQNPIYYASLLGLTDVVKWLEEQGLDCSCVGGRFGFPLQAAVARNQEEVVNHLLSRNIDVSQTGGQYGAAIVAAAALSTPEMVEILLAAGANVTAVDEAGYTALHHASIRGSAQEIKSLVGRGANIDAITPTGSTSASFACSLGHKDALLALIANGANFELAGVDEPLPLHLAIINSHEDLACMLLEAGVCVDTAFQDDSRPLHLAVRMGSLKLVKKLLEKKADPDLLNNRKWTALQLAAAIADIEIVKVLIDVSAEISCLNSEAAPLQIAALYNRPSIIKLLYEHGADLDQKTEDNMNALIVAVSEGYHDVVETLLDLKASMQCIWEHTQMTIFDMASEAGRLDIVELLLKHGCFRMQRQTDITRHQGTEVAAEKEESLVMLAYNGDAKAVEDFINKRRDVLTSDDLSEALQITSARGHVSIVKFLLSKGALVNAKDINGRTALHYATRHSHEVVADVLVQNGASIYIEDGIGSTPIDLAVVNGEKAIGFIKKHMDDLTLHISRRPSLLEASTHQTVNLSSSQVRQAITGSWTGSYECLSWLKGQQDPFSIVIPTILPEEPPSCTFSSKNEDTVGEFQFHGFVDRIGTIWFVKLYEKHGWLYRGQLDLDKRTLKGTWGSNKKLWFGTFHLTHTS